MVKELCEHELKNGVKDFCWPCFYWVNARKPIKWSLASATLMMDGMRYFNGGGY